MKSRITWESVKDRSFEDLKHEAVERLNETSEGLIEWGHRAKDRNYPFLFQWQIDAPFNGFTHATSRVMAGLRRAGVLDKVISENDKKLGLEWIRSIYDEASKNYNDPFLLTAKPRLFLEASAVNREKTGEDLPWPPTGAVREGLNHYSGIEIHADTSKIKNSVQVKHHPLQRGGDVYKFEPILVFYKK